MFKYLNSANFTPFITAMFILKLFERQRYCVEHRVSQSQMDELLQHLMEHPSLVKGVVLGARSKETIDREWTNLATRLNAHGNGATKTGQRWKRYWADLKFKTKNKVSARRREAFSTGGGGPATLEDLSENDKKKSQASALRHYCLKDQAINNTNLVI